MAKKAAANSDSSPKKVVVKKDKADKPKTPKAKSAYMIFSLEKRAEVIKANPDLSKKPPEIMKKLGEMWKSLSDSAKKPYVEKSDADKKRIANEKSSA